VLPSTIKCEPTGGFSANLAWASRHWKISQRILLITCHKSTVNAAVRTSVGAALAPSSAIYETLYDNGSFRTMRLLLR
jgi:hypothetical protein